MGEEGGIIQPKWGDVGLMDEEEEEERGIQVKWSDSGRGWGEEREEGEEGEEGGVYHPDVVEEKERVNMFMILCVFVVSVSSVLLGYDIGVMSGAVIFIREEMQLSDIQQGILIGSLNLISAVGAAIAGLATDELGRKWIVFLSAFIGFVGSVGMALSFDFWSILIFRLTNGVAIGIGLVLGPIYVAELSPRSLRGSLVAIGEVAVNVGILLGYISNLLFSGLPNDLAWRVMVGMGAIPGLVLFVCIAMLPESPRWLFMHGFKDEASQVLKRAKYSENQIQDILEEIEEVLESTKGEEVEWRELILCSSPFIRNVMIVGLGIQFFQQAVGVETCVYYTPQVLGLAGMTETKQVLAGSVVIGVIKLLFIFPPMLMMEKRGRKPFLYVSLLGMFSALLLLSVAFGGVIFETPSAGFTLFAIALYMASFSFGIGPGNWVISSEVFPLKIRGRAMALGVIVNRSISGLVASTFLPLSAAISVSGAFMVYAVMCIFGGLFVRFILPETKGKSLEEIERMFQERADGGTEEDMVEIEEVTEEGDTQ